MKNKLTFEYYCIVYILSYGLIKLAPRSQGISTFRYTNLGVILSMYYSLNYQFIYHVYIIIKILYTVHYWGWFSNYYCGGGWKNSLQELSLQYLFKQKICNGLSPGV